MNQFHPIVKEKVIISYHDISFIEKTIPSDWDSYTVIDPHNFADFDFDPNLHELYPWGDYAYDTLAHSINIPELGFCKKLSELCNDKFVCRDTLESMKDIPYTICDNTIVNWPGDPNDKLIAKPVDGCGSNGLHIVKHGDVLPDDGNTYIIELYIEL